MYNLVIEIDGNDDKVRLDGWCAIDLAEAHAMSIEFGRNGIFQDYGRDATVYYPAHRIIAVVITPVEG